MIENSTYIGGVRFYVDDGTLPSLNWSRGLLIVYALTDGITVNKMGATIRLKETDFLSFNPYEGHTIEPIETGPARFLVMEFSEQLLQAVDLKNKRFVCCSAQQQEQGAYDGLRQSIAALFEAYSAERDGCEFELYSLSWHFLHQLNQYFCRSAQFEDFQRHDTILLRMKHISDYITANYSRSITLTDVAEHEFLSAGYLSQFFAKHYGLSFSKYLSTVRLAHAQQLLHRTNLSITQIAMDCGFPNANTFISVFRERYHTTPGKYRTELHSESAKEHRNAFDETDPRYQALLRYRTVKTDTTACRPVVHDVQTVELSAGHGAETLVPSWNRLASIGYAHEGLTAVVQAQLKQAQADIGFEYLRFHGIFDDEMRVYSETESGQPVYNFFYTDSLLDFVRSIDMKPFIELGYMPEKLALHKRRSYAGGIISMPNDREKWCELVGTFVRHCVSRYGLREVQTWYFTVLGINYTLYDFFTEEEYFEHYLDTYRTVKLVSPKLRFGGPSMEGSLLLQDENEVLDPFLTFCQQQECMPDFITLHAYPHDFSRIPDDFDHLMNGSELYPMNMLADRDFISHILDAAQRTMKAHGQENCELILDEFTSTIWQRDIYSDTCYKAAFLAKQLLENANRCSMMGYWLLTDYMGEIPPENRPFHGGFGLVTHNGIRKAGYWVLQLLNRLDGEIIAQDKGCFAVQNESGVQIVLYNYSAYNRMYRNHIEPAQSDDYYAVFTKTRSDEYEIVLRDLLNGSYRIRSWSVSREHGSAFDCWLRMGAPDHMTAEETDCLNALSRPFCEVRNTALMGAALTLHESVQPHAVKVISVQKE